MPISDLTGTKWVINSSPTFTDIQSNTFYINFSSDSNDFNELTYPATNPFTNANTIEYGGGKDFQIAYDSSNGGWTSEAYRTIEITGGTGATNATLIAWLEANATQQTPVQTSGGMYLGTLGISKIFVGNSEVSKIYLGDALVYDGVSIPDNALLTADNTYLVDSTGGYLLTTEIALISFTIDGEPYQAESGMTWEQWCDSDYNTDSYVVYNGIITTYQNAYAVTALSGKIPHDVYSSDTIIADTAYSVRPTGGSN